MKYLLTAVLSTLMLFAVPSEASVALKKVVDGQTCIKTSVINPVWSFKEGASATSGNFTLRWGRDPNSSITTSVCPNAPVLVLINIAGCPTQQGYLEGCPLYLPGIFFSYVTMTNANGNLLIPLNGQDILNAGGNAAFQAFVGDTLLCNPSAPTEVHASRLCTLYDANSSPIYACQ